MWLVLLAAVLVGPAVGIGLAAAGTLDLAMAVHAALMVTAWGLMIPAGGVVARYFKVMPGQDFPRILDNLTWWHWHRGLQYSGLVLSTIGLGVIVWDAGNRLDTLHGRCGIVVMTLGWLQVGSTLLRGNKGGPTDRLADPRDPSTWRGDHYDMTPRRRAFEAWHKPVGWLVMGLAAVTILLGVQLVGVPPWLLFTVGCLQAAFLLAVLDGAARHRWVDTYAALWGYDPRHPGNRQSADGEKSETDLVDHLR